MFTIVKYFNFVLYYKYFSDDTELKGYTEICGKFACYPRASCRTDMVGHLYYQYVFSL